MKNNQTQQKPERAIISLSGFTKGMVACAFASAMFLTSCKEDAVDPVIVDPPNPPAAITLDGRINQDRILEDHIADPLLPDYIATGDVEINAKLTIQPGVVIAMPRDAQFTILEQRGSIVAKGTAEKKIRFVGQQPTKGFWMGMVNNSESTANALEFVEIMHTGSKTILDNKKMALALVRDSQTSVKNCFFGENNGYGLFVQGDAVLTGFAQNTFRSNAEAGISVPSKLVEMLDFKSGFTGGNGRNVVEVTGAYIGETGAKNEIVWNGFEDKTPYRIMETVAVRTGWKIVAGVTVEVARDEAIIINEEAYLLAQGTEEAKVRFTGMSEEANWKGMLIHSTNNRNALTYTEVSHAGSSTIINGEKANVALYGDGAYVTIRNSKISGSDGYGLYIGNGSRVNADFEETTTFENNKSGNILSAFAK